MGRFLCFPSRRILLVAIFGLLVCFKESNHEAAVCYQKSEPMLALALSTPSPRRPPRIRPKRQSTLPSNENKNKNKNNQDETVNDNPQPSKPKKKSQHEQALGDPSLLTGIRFADRTDLHPHTKEALTDGFGLKTMTVVQASTYEEALQGQSILARSKTGSGKTLAFLLPVLERLLSKDSDYLPGRSIGCLVLAPTRELAIQIADQAEILVDYHNKHRQRPLKVACIYGESRVRNSMSATILPNSFLALLVPSFSNELLMFQMFSARLLLSCFELKSGGVKMQRDVRLLMGDRRGGGTGDLPTILVSTPSRLLEHLEGNSPLQKNFRGQDMVSRKGNKSRFAAILAQTTIVVLDETDRLLQKSNLKETQRVLSFLARTEKRQTLLFSATFPRAVRRLLLSSDSSILRKGNKSNQSNSSETHGDFLEVDCCEKNESANSAKANDESQIINEKRIQESYVNLQNMAQFIPTLLTVVRREQERDGQNYKILVFFPAGRLVRFLFQFFTIGGLEKRENLWEIHSRMSQSSRTRASSSFRKARRGILFSSDVSARGLDYPDVSLVVQMGAPSSDQDYVHRIGRTGRAGKVGKSLLVLLPFEKNERKKPQRKRGGGQVSYRNDESLEEDVELASWLRQPDSLYQRCEEELEPTLSKVRSGHVVLTPGAQASYKTFLAHYTTPSNRKGSKNTSEILNHAQDFVEGAGLAHIPKLDEDFASKLGLPN